MALRKHTLDDAFALAMINGGRFHFCQPHVKSKLWDHYDYAPGEAIGAGQSWINPTETGEAALTASPLWAAHMRLIQMGYTLEIGRDLIRPRKHTKRYIAYTRWNDELGRNDEAWISASGSKPVIFISRRQSEGGSYILGAEA